MVSRKYLSGYSDDKIKEFSKSSSGFFGNRTEKDIRKEMRRRGLF
jgi:hypothetical protein